MTCIRCSTNEFRDAHHVETQKVEGMLFRATIPAQKCRMCGWLYLDPFALDRFELVVADSIADFTTSKGWVFRLLRRALRIPIAELARTLRVEATDIGEWESEACEPAGGAFEALRSLVRSRLRESSGELALQ